MVGQKNSVEELDCPPKPELYIGRAGFRQELGLAQGIVLHPY
jgi:hypothetical protein